jgi:hypothetical protein
MTGYPALQRSASHFFEPSRERGAGLLLLALFVNALGLPAGFLTGPLVVVAAFATTNHPVIRFPIHLSSGPVRHRGDAQLFHQAARVNPVSRAGRQVGFSVAEVRISASTNELAGRLIQGFPRIESPANQSL